MEKNKNTKKKIFGAILLIIIIIILLLLRQCSCSGAKDAGAGVDSKATAEAVEIVKIKVDVPSPNLNLTYNGEEQIGVTLPENAAYTLSGNTGTNASRSYTAIASLKDKDKYEWNLSEPTSEDQTIRWTISKKTVHVRAKDQSSDEGDDLVSLTYTSDYLIGKDTYAGKLVTNADKDTPGEYVITQGNLTAGENYLIHFHNATYTVKALKTPTVTAPKAVDKLTYKGEEQTLITAGKVVGGTMQYKLNDGKYSTDLPKATNAGEYTVYYKVVGNEGYKDVAEASFKVTIAPKSITVKADDKKSDVGSELVELTYLSKGLVGEDAISGKLSTDADKNQTGNYDILIGTLTAGVNYEISFTPGTYTVLGKPAPTITAEPAAASGLVYDGTEQVLITSGSVSGGTLYYKLDGGDYSIDVPTAKNAGNYTAYYKVVGDNEHSDIAETAINVVISPRNITLSSDSATKDYDGTALTANGYTITDGSFAANEVDDITPNFTGSQTNAGFSENTFVIGSSTVNLNNYNITFVYGILTVNALDVTFNYVEPIISSGWIYDGTEQPLVDVPGTADQGEWLYKVDDGGYSTDVPSATDAKESYVVSYKLETPENYKNIEGSCSVTVEKAEQEDSKIEIELTQEKVGAYDNITYYNVTVVSTGGVGNVQYAMGDDEGPISAWQSSNVFNNVPGGTYFYVKYSGNDNYKEKVKYSLICCFAAGTKITMADGSLKNIEDVVVGDSVLTLNHFTGECEGQKVYYAFKGEGKALKYELCFDDGTKVSLTNEHYLFEQESLDYVRISMNNVESLIGNHYYSVNAGGFIELMDVIYYEEPVDFYTLYTEYNANYFAEGMLNVSDDMDICVKIYEYNKDLTVNRVKLAIDILKYGIYEYPEDANYSKELYDAQGWKYMNIIVGKGLATWDDLFARRDAFLAGE